MLGVWLTQSGSRRDRREIEATQAVRNLWNAVNDARQHLNPNAAGFESFAWFEETTNLGNRFVEVRLALRGMKDPAAAAVLQRVFLPTLMAMNQQRLAPSKAKLQHVMRLLNVVSNVTAKWLESGIMDAELLGKQLEAAQQVHEQKLAAEEEAAAIRAAEGEAAPPTQEA